MVIVYKVHYFLPPALPQGRLTTRSKGISDGYSNVVSHSTGLRTLCKMYRKGPREPYDEMCRGGECRARISGGAGVNRHRVRHSFKRVHGPAICGRGDPVVQKRRARALSVNAQKLNVSQNKMWRATYGCGTYKNTGRSIHTPPSSPNEVAQPWRRGTLVDLVKLDFSY